MPTLGKANKDPVAALDALEPRPGTIAQFAQLLAERPDIAERINAAYTRGVSYQAIAEALTSADIPTSADTVNKWCRREFGPR